MKEKKWRVCEDEKEREIKREKQDCARRVKGGSHAGASPEVDREPFLSISSFKPLRPFLLYPRIPSLSYIGKSLSLAPCLVEGARNSESEDDQRLDLGSTRLRLSPRSNIHINTQRPKHKKIQTIKITHKQTGAPSPIPCMPRC